MLDKEMTLTNKIIKNGKFEINVEIEKAINLEQAGIDGSRFGLGNQESWLKQNIPEMAKTMISGPKQWNLAKKRNALATKLLTSSRNAETRQLGEFCIILTSTSGLQKFSCL